MRKSLAWLLAAAAAPFVTRLRRSRRVQAAIAPRHRKRSLAWLVPPNPGPFTLPPRGRRWRHAPAAPARAKRRARAPLSLAALALTRRFLAVAPAWLYIATAPAWRYVVTAPENVMPFVRDNPPVTVGRKQTVGIDFGNFLPPGVTLTGVPAVVVSVYSGSDPSPGAIVVSGPVVTTAATAVGGTGDASTAIALEILGAVPGVVYAINLACGRSDGADQVDGTIHQPIVAIS